ncbi:MAG: PHB depolymerase family esterase [Aeromicrobium sp.]
MPAPAYAFGAVRPKRWAVALALILGVVGVVHAGDPSGAVRADPTACTGARLLPTGTTAHAMQHDGQVRSYLLHVPPGYDATQRTSVVAMFHGLGGTPAKILAASGMNSLADREGFIVVAPLARGAISQWDFRTPPGDVRSDAHFTRALVAEVRSRGCIDGSRIYAAGFSNGSALVLALACDAESPFAAYGAVSGPYMAPDCARAKPASIAYFHGMRDKRVPYEGAETVIGPMPSVDDTVAQWVAHDRCPAVGATTTAIGALRHLSWRGCADGSAISVHVLRDEGHRWPGSQIDASSVMWEFFQSVEG